jgi:hypothetical protein
MKKNMQTEIENIPNQPSGSLNVLVAYDGLRAGIQAKELCDRLTRKLGPANELHLGFWSLSALQLPQLAQSAAEEASETDLLIVAVDGDEVLPRPFKSWVSQCLRKIRAHGGTLVVQLHGIVKMTHELSPAYECLKHLADDARVGFFAEVLEPAGDKLDESLESIHRRAHMRSSVLDAILQAH